MNSPLDVLDVADMSRFEAEQKIEQARQQVLEFVLNDGMPDREAQGELCYILEGDKSETLRMIVFWSNHQPYAVLAGAEDTFFELAKTDLSDSLALDDLFDDLESETLVFNPITGEFLGTVYDFLEDGLNNVERIAHSIPQMLDSIKERPESSADLKRNFFLAATFEEVRETELYNSLVRVFVKFLPFPVQDLWEGNQISAISEARLPPSCQPA